MSRANTPGQNWRNTELIRISRTPGTRQTVVYVTLRAGEIGPYPVNIDRDVYFVDRSHKSAPNKPLCDRIDGILQHYTPSAPEWYRRAGSDPQGEFLESEEVETRITFPTLQSLLNHLKANPSERLYINDRTYVTYTKQGGHRCHNSLLDAPIPASFNALTLTKKETV